MYSPMISTDVFQDIKRDFQYLRVTMQYVSILTMMNSSDHSLSRRKWLGLAAKTSLASGVLAIGGGPSASASDAQVSGVPAGSGHDLGARVYNIRDFGAKGDGTALDTSAVQAA